MAAPFGMGELGLRIWLAAVVCAMAAGAHAACEPLENDTVPEGFDSCGEAREVAGQVRYCQASFAYRDPQARSAFLRLNAEIAACLGQPVATPDDALVNHPDSYDLRQYPVEGGLLSLSLKDKAGLGQTILFLRLTLGQ